MSFNLNVNQLKKKPEIEPSQIFRGLNRNKKYAYPRDVQDQVWSDWFKKRDKKNLVLKMNTGSGKTVVGLTILQSCLNEEKGPALFLCPNIQLVNQVMNTANELGVSVTDNPKSIEFKSSEAICITTIQKLINGKSVFGVGNSKIDIGSIVIDDAHACLDIVEEQFTLNIPRNSDCGKEIWSLLEGDIKRQYENKYIDLNNLDPHAQVLVPYWSWQDRASDIYKLLYEYKEDECLLFKWELIKDHLKYCHCVCTHKNFEISPFQVPIDVISSIKNTSRVIFMTATLADDSILFSHFDVKEYKRENVVQPKNCNDIGERLILIPKSIDTNVEDEQIRDFAIEQSKTENVVVIVPSFDKATFWEGDAHLMLSNDNINEGVEALKARHVGLTILVNRYDGVDLPDDACRLLIIDGVPTIDRWIDNIEDSYLPHATSTRFIQKIEQGMGRGTRSNLDYCAIILMDDNLIDRLYVKDAVQNFSPATKQQYELSKKVIQQIKEQNATFKNAVHLCLSRNEDWMNANKSVLSNIEYSEPSPKPRAVILREVFNSFVHKLDTRNTICKLQNIINETGSSDEKGILQQYLASYINFTDQYQAQQIQLSAKTLNQSVLSPIEGITYEKMYMPISNQAKRCCQHFNNYSDPNKLILEIEAIIKDLAFGVKANLFEAALASIANFIGFISSRPDSEINKGPDVLLNISPNNYLVIECKNEATAKVISKNYCGQLLSSTNWFTDEYKVEENSIFYISIMVHPSLTFDYHASPSKNFRIITKEKLDSFVTKVYSFIRSVVNNNYINQDVNSIQNQIKQHGLESENFVENFTCEYKIRN